MDAALYSAAQDTSSISILSWLLFLSDRVNGTHLTLINAPDEKLPNSAEFEAQDRSTPFCSISMTAFGLHGDRLTLHSTRYNPVRLIVKTEPGGSKAMLLPTFSKTSKMIFSNGQMHCVFPMASIKLDKKGAVPGSPCGPRGPAEP